MTGLDITEEARQGAQKNLEVNPELASMIHLVINIKPGDPIQGSVHLRYEAMCNYGSIQYHEWMNRGSLSLYVPLMYVGQRVWSKAWGFHSIHKRCVSFFPKICTCEILNTNKRIQVCTAYEHCYSADSAADQLKIQEILLSTPIDPTLRYSKSAFQCRLSHSNSTCMHDAEAAFLFNVWNHVELLWLVSICPNYKRT